METENLSSIYKFLNTTGVYIADSSKFIDFLKENGNDVEKTMNRIKDSKEKKERKIEYSNFEKKVVEYFQKIQNAINDDDLFKRSSKKDTKEFQNFFQSIVDKYIIIHKLKDDKDECKKKIKEITDLKEKINTLNNSKKGLTANDIEEINMLNFKLKVKNKEYQSVMDKIEEEAKVITSYSDRSEFIKLIDSFNEDINTLLTHMDKLTLTTRTRVETINLFNNLIDELSLDKRINEEALKEFDELCENAGIGISTPSLEKNDIVIYNGTKPYYGPDNTKLLKEGRAYKITGSRFSNNGLEEFYLEGFDEPFSVTLFDSPTLAKNDIIVYNGSKPYYGVDNTNLLKTGQTYKVNGSNVNDNGYEEVYLNGFDKPFSVTLFDTLKEWKSRPKPSLEKGDVVVYNGTKPYFGEDNSNILKVGQTYKVIKSNFDVNGLEEFYLEGFDKPFSVTLFDTLNEWKEKQQEEEKNNVEIPTIKPMLPKENKVTNVEPQTPNPIRKKNIYANAILGMQSKKLSLSLKKALSNTLIKLKDKITNFKNDFINEELINAENDYYDEDIPTIEDSKAFWDTYYKLKNSRKTR